jgi:DNA-directed RNA polymerase subunit RPC12/RpoP
VIAMARWTLRCDNCKFEFTHSMIEGSGVANFFQPPKPEFPHGGAELECPNCGHKDTYQRHELAYQYLIRSRLWLPVDNGKTMLVVGLFQN